ncbi:MAG: adenine-specific methyltransferase EcoRI family protein [Candidatus Cloacimonetes bacterium]|nr:adenine-specific methyltransferase EcoRI family protein [Candidatus Cloacimonadota bacterium]
MAGNASLRKAGKTKNDEFYTQLTDIEKEMKYYKAHFKNKVVFCNCDDPYESNFFKYFAINFNYLGLKKLIATCYDSSPVSGEQLSLFDIPSIKMDLSKNKKAYKIEITEVEDLNNDGAINMSDVEYLLKNKKNILTMLKEDGDFRSNESVELLRESDIVVTNPPFSLFREYIAQLVEYNKRFIVLGNQNAITYKEIFPLLKDNKMWLGYNSGAQEFLVPNDYEKENIYVGSDGKKYAKFGNITWFTNLETTKRQENLILYKKYIPEEYSKYDYFDAINIDRVSNIPFDYDGEMGVPITFLEKYNPKQFKIIDLLTRYNLIDPYNKNEILQRDRAQATYINGKPKFARILIKRIDMEDNDGN